MKTEELVLNTGIPKKMDAFDRLIFELSKLPGVGEKTATRLAYYILKQDASYAQNLAQALTDAKQKIGQCQICFNFSDQTTCSICTNPQRDESLLCVIERPVDVTAFEQSGGFNGKYHVLHGVLSPLDGIGPEELRIKELLKRMNHETKPIREMILAMNPSVEGDATALYLTKLIRPFGIKLTRLAHGLPVGGMIEYVDRQTLGRALQYRVEMQA